MDSNAARDHFANVITQIFLGASIAIEDGADPNATAFFFSWWMPDKKRNSQEIAVLLYSVAMDRFINATAQDRGQLLERFERIIRIRVADGGYNPEEQSPDSFKVHIRDLLE